MSLEIMQRIAAAVTPEIIQAYQNDGAICIKQVLTKDELTCLQKGIELNLSSPSSRVKIASRENDPGLFIEDFCTWQNNPFYQEIIFQSVLGGIAAKLMQSNTSRLYHDHLLVKEAGTKQRTPWHQDQPYYNINGKQNCSIWIPVDPVPRASTLEFVAGTHLGPWLMPRSFMTNEAKWFPENTLTELPDIEAKPEDYKIIGWEINPGDIVCFHMLSLHAASGSMNRRRVFSVRFMGDDITHAPRSWVTSPDFPNLSKELPAGAAMNHPLFPITWPK